MAGRFRVTCSRLPRRCNNYVPEVDRTMISLQHDRTGFTFLTVHGAAGDARDLLVTDYCFPVEYNRYHSAGQRNIVGLPFAGALSHHFRWRKKTVNGAQLIVQRLLTFAVFDLNFVTATQVDTAVTAGGVAEFDMNFEIAESLIGDDV